MTDYNVVFGLTADPIHKGHEQAIINAVLHLRGSGNTIKQLLLTPVYQPNLIANKEMPVASYSHRVNMCLLIAKKLSMQLNCKISVNQIEKKLTESTGEKNYTYKTIKQLNLANCLFMVSADHFSGRWPKFRKWYKIQQLLKHTGLLINQRPKHRINRNYINTLKSLNPDILIIKNMKDIDISSSTIKQGNINKANLSSDVLAYINKNTLYKS